MKVQWNQTGSRLEAEWKQTGSRIYVNAPLKGFQPHCELLLLLRFLMYVNDYGTQWRIVRATLTMPAITDG